MEILGKLIDVKDIVIGWLVRPAVIAFLVLAGNHYDENPLLISIIFVIGLTILIFGTDEALLLTSSGLIIRKTFLGVWSRNKIIAYSEIKSMDCTGNYTLGKEAFFFFMPGSKSADPNEIQIKLKDGSVMEFRFHIFKDKIIEFVALGNRLIN